VTSASTSVDPLWVCLGVREAERRSPRHARDHPALDAVVSAQRLDVVDEVRRCVGTQIGIRIARQGAAAPRPALVEQHGAVRRRMEERSMPRGAAGTGSAVQEERRFRARITAAFPVHAMPVADPEHAGLIGLSCWQTGVHSTQDAFGPLSFSEPAILAQTLSHRMERCARALASQPQLHHAQPFRSACAAT
jgi:hypothetical protein